MYCCVLILQFSLILRSCEILLAKKDKRSVQTLALMVLEDKQIAPVTQVRALRLLAQCDRTTAPQYLARAFTLATTHYLRFYRHLIIFDILNKQVRANYMLLVSILCFKIIL